MRQMTTRPATTLRWLLALAALVAVGALWEELAPTKLGGSHEYAVIDGTSMNPKLHAGDLVVMHTSSAYAVGDVVGYHNRELGRLVLHRIVGKVGDRDVFKGDNNDFLDSYHPLQADLVGRLWLSVPKAGGFFTWLHDPNHSGITVAVLAALLLAGGGAGIARHGRRGRRVRHAITPSPALGRALLTSAAGVALLFAFVALVGFSHAPTATVQSPGAFVSQGDYAYSARVPASSLYPSGRVGSGQTVFTQLVRRVATSFAYRFVTADPHSVSGDATLVTTLRSSTGWTKRLSSRSARLRGDGVTLTGTIDVQRLEREIAQYAKLTGIANDSFDVVLAPAVHVRGTVDGTPVTTDFTPTPLTFALDGYSLRLQQSAAASQPGATVSSADALHPSEPGVMSHSRPASARLVVASMRVSTARTLGIAGLVLAALLALAGLLVSGVSGDELSRIRRRGGGMLVPVSSPPAAPAGGFVDVANFDSLVHLARSYQLVILHHQRGDAHSFYIDDDGSIYRFSVRAGERHAQIG